MFGKMKKASARAKLIEYLTERCANFQLHSNHYKTWGEIVTHEWEARLENELIIDNAWPSVKAEVSSKLGEKLFSGEIAELCDIIELMHKNISHVLQTAINTPSEKRPPLVNMAQARKETMEYLNSIVREFINYDDSIDETERVLNDFGDSNFLEGLKQRFKSEQEKRDRIEQKNKG